MLKTQTGFSPEQHVARVSVIIPTVGRPQLQAAIKSTLAQTLPIHELLIVADTLDQIDYPADPRITVIRVGPGAGGNVARQAGIEKATGNIIALLDDDDEWLPNKLEHQIKSVSAMTDIDDPTWLCASRVIKRTPGQSDFNLPAFPFPGGKLTHYLFKRSGVSSDHGFVQASTILFPRALAIEVPFDITLKFHQDISWLIDVSIKYPHLNFIQCWEGLTIYNTTQGSVSKRISPEQSIAWATNRLGGDPRILGDFILTQSMGFAKNTGSAKRIISTLMDGLAKGKPGLPAIIYGIITATKAILMRNLKR